MHPDVLPSGFSFQVASFQNGRGRHEGLSLGLGLHNAAVALLWWDIHIPVGGRLLPLHL